MATARNPKRRVKVYQLNGEGLWLDRGTGFLQVIFSDASHETYFQVKNELNDELLLHSRIYSEDVYQLQQGAHQPLFFPLPPPCFFPPPLFAQRMRRACCALHKPRP